MATDQPSPEATPRPGTVHPHLARERALKVLFQADVRGEDPRVVLDRVAATRGALELLDELEPDEVQVAGDVDLQAELARRRRVPLDDYTRTLVSGVAGHRGAIDRVLGEVAEHWTVERMPVVDRNLLRLAVYELAAQDTPPAVVIDEAVSLAGGFAGERARPFVNGVLETVRRRVAAGELALDPASELALDPASELALDPADDAPDGLPAAGVTPPPSGPVGDDGEDEATQDAWAAALDLLTDEDAAGDVAEDLADDVPADLDDPGGPVTDRA